MDLSPRRPRRALCVGAFLLLVPAGARPGYRCGQHTNPHAFAALDDQGRIHAWGHSDWGGSGAPSGTGFTAIFSTPAAFAALDEQGAIHSWGDSGAPSGAPSGTGFTALSSTDRAFAALDDQGAIHVWGNHERGGSGAPCGTGFTIASLSYSDTMGSDACPLPSLVRPTPCTEYTDEETCNAQDKCNWDGSCLHLPTPCTEYTDEQ